MEKVQGEPRAAERPSSALSTGRNHGLGELLRVLPTTSANGDFTQPSWSPAVAQEEISDWLRSGSCLFLEQSTVAMGAGMRLENV